LEVVMHAIVVGFDDTGPARRALQRAAWLAEVACAKLLVVSVVPLLVGAGRSAGPFDSTDPPECHRAQLDAAREALHARGVSAEFILGVGEPARVIVELAEQRGAELIVLGSRQLRLIERLFGQSVTRQVAGQTRCDVLIVH